MADSLQLANGLVAVEGPNDGTLTIRFTRPEKLNALIEPMRQTLADILESLADREDVRACIITGSGRGFCAGGDIQVMRGLIEERRHEEVHRFLDLGARVVTTIRALPIPVIAAVNGAAAGAGLNLALACDYRIASDRATFGETFVNIGLHSDWGGAYLLPALVGSSRALELLWTGRVVDAAEAERLGMVDRVVPHEHLAETALTFAHALCERPRDVLALSKRSVYESQRHGLEHGLRMEKEAQTRCLEDNIASDLMREFLTKRGRKVEA